MSLPLYPIWLVDLVGSGLMIVFSFLCIREARRLRDLDQTNIVWTYLLWVSYCLAVFSVSRSAGHIVKRVFLSLGYNDLWVSLQPMSGAMNTLMFLVLASITLFFERIWKIYQQIVKDKLTLQETHDKILFMNKNLENLVAERSQDLIRSEQNYRKIFEVSPDMIVVTAGSGKILEMNPAGRKMLNLSLADKISGLSPFYDFFDSLNDWKSIEEALRAEDQVSDMEIQMKRCDGLPLRALVSASAERRPDGAIKRILFLIKDISQRKSMERQLLQADKMASIGQLAAGIAHEINNPLSMILGYTQLLLREEEQGTEKSADLKIIEKHARNCKTIVGDLLSFSRSTRTKKEVSQLNTALEEVLSVVRHQCELDKIEIQKELDPGIPAMVFDEAKIKQVFMNLIMNAKQAIGSKGAIRLKTLCEQPNGMVLIQVADTGCGIEPEDLSRIFDPFFTTKATGEGTGLGLSVSYGIVKNHGGEILVESEPGKGSTFTVVLPVSLEQAGKK